MIAVFWIHLSDIDKAAALIVAAGIVVAPIIRSMSASKDTKVPGSGMISIEVVEPDNAVLRVKASMFS